MTRPSVVDIIKRAKTNSWTVILGGPEAANYTDEYLSCGADYIVLGEGEITLHELLTMVKKDDFDPATVDGIAYQTEQETSTKTAPRDLPQNIDQFPWPDRDAIDLKQYFSAWQKHHGTSSVSMITARGCPYKCTWCSHAVFGYSHRRREPADCADELQHIMTTYNPAEVWYADDVFTINHKWIIRYAEELRKRNLKVPFETISRADRMLDTKVMDALQEMGCYRIWIGAESGSQRLLDQMKRGVTVDQIARATEAAKSRGIEVGMFLMWGFGDENLNDIDETVNAIAKIAPDIYLTTTAYPIKGTEFYSTHKNKITLDKPWEIASDRDLVMDGKQSARYYHLANKYLKSHVESSRLETKNKIALSNIKNRHAKKYRALLEAESCL
jgi:anaerobic magnesium-protoporphyrin IX monomethyl ester cyclase